MVQANIGIIINKKIADVKGIVYKKISRSSTPSKPITDTMVSIRLQEEKV
jgi:hypothetical protein